MTRDDGAPLVALDARALLKTQLQRYRDGAVYRDVVHIVSDGAMFCVVLLCVVAMIDSAVSWVGTAAQVLGPMPIWPLIQNEIGWCLAMSLVFMLHSLMFHVRVLGARLADGKPWAPDQEGGWGLLDAPEEQGRLDQALYMRNWFVSRSDQLPVPFRACWAYKPTLQETTRAYAILGLEQPGFTEWEPRLQVRAVARAALQAHIAAYK